MTKSPVARLRNERGVTTAEYAVVTAAGCGFAGRADQAAHQRLRPAAAQDPVRAPHEGRRALTVLDGICDGGGDAWGVRAPRRPARRRRRDGAPATSAAR